MSALLSATGGVSVATRALALVPAPETETINETLATSLLSPDLVNEIINSENGDRMLAVARLIVINAHKALNAFVQGRFKQLDPLVGDFGCELYALRNLHLIESDSLIKEASALSGTVKALIDALNASSCKANMYGMVNRAVALQLFQGVTKTLISQEMAALLRMHLLTVTKRLYKKNGEEKEKTDISSLDGLSKGIGESRKRIVDELQAKLSRQTYAHFKEQAARIKCLSDRESKILTDMLSLVREPTESTCKETGVATSIEPTMRKVIGCCFYKIKAGLLILRERQTLIGLKQMLPAGQNGFVLLFRANVSNGPIVPLSDEECKRVLEQDRKRANSRTPIILFEGAVNPSVTAQELAKRIEEIGLQELILANASQESPYDYGSSEDDIPIEEARNEIAGYKALSERIGCVKGQSPMFMLDHVYLNTLRYEVR